MEGPGETEFTDGWMEVFSPEREFHHVFWCPVDFPDRFVAQWEAQNLDPEYGLCIIFFAAKGMEGEDIFDPSLPERDGTFGWYIKDRLRSYHISYYANTPKKPDRRVAHIRKNNEFRMVQQGEVGIPPRSTRPHQLTLIKDGPHIRFFIDDRKVIDWTDTDENEPRQAYGEGKIGFRQMQWTHFRYRNLRVWDIDDPAARVARMDDLPVIHPRLRQWAQPAFDLPARHNPPSLLWPIASAGADTRWDVRLSQDRDFVPGATIEGTDLKWGIFNPHQTLASGRWYWQYRQHDQEWSDAQSFLVTPESIAWNPPPARTLVESVPRHHPRMLVDKGSIPEFRARARGTQEAERVIALAEAVLGRDPPQESEGVRTIDAESPEKIDKLEKDAAKALGQELYSVVSRLCKAYALTGNPRYAEDAIRWAMEGASWDPAGVTRLNDFGDSRIMLAMAMTFDTFHQQLEEDQRAALLTAIRARGNHFFESYVNGKEAAVLSNHVWQHILHYFFDTSVAVLGEIEEAEDWLGYIYEIFLARVPVLGGDDGGWAHGLSYFRMNMETLIDIPWRIREYTGFDFMAHIPWYQQNTNYFLYGFPAGSAGTGFADNSHDLPEPRGDYLAYADTLARLTNNGHAAWYRDRIEAVARDVKPHVQDYMRMERVTEDAASIAVAGSDMLLWQRLRYLYRIPAAPATSPGELPMARHFRSEGLVTIHGLPLDAPLEERLMVAARASPFGTYSHMLGDNNTFNIVYGGDRLFYHTGYKVAMKAPHRLHYYKHTRSHNGILVDGEGQPYNTEAYAWFENFLDGEAISYALGNAGNAYDSETLGADAGLRTFRRHFVMLRPDILVIYDDLEAVRPVEWSYLLHSYREIEIDPDQEVLKASNRAGGATVHLKSSSPASWDVTDEYSVPAENWRQTRDGDGNLVAYTDNAWHFTATTEPARANRFLAILQVRPNGRLEPFDFNELLPIDANTFSLGKWRIEAEMDPERPAVIRIHNTIDGVAFTSVGQDLDLNGTRYRGKREDSAKLVEDQRLTESSAGIPEAALPALRHFGY